MPVYEYKVVPAPVQGKKARGIKGTPARFALSLETVMNELGAEGWEYVRSDTLPCEERVGLTGRTTTFQNMLVFRKRARAADEAQEDAPVTALLTPPTQPAPLPAPEPEATAAAEEDAPDAPETTAAEATVKALATDQPEVSGTSAPEVGPATRSDRAQNSGVAAE